MGASGLRYRAKRSAERAKPTRDRLNLAMRESTAPGRTLPFVMHETT
jgi:hypothetical protein